MSITVEQNILTVKTIIHIYGFPDSGNSASAKKLTVNI